MIEVLNKSKEDQQKLTQSSQPLSELSPHRVRYIEDPKTGMHRVTVLNQDYRGEGNRIHLDLGNGTTTKNKSGRLILNALAQLPRLVVVTEAYREPRDAQKAIDGRNRVLESAGFSDEDTVDRIGGSKGANLASLAAQQDDGRTERLFTVEGVCANNKTRLHLAQGVLGVLPEVVGSSFRTSAAAELPLIDIPDDHGIEFDTQRGALLNFAAGALVGRLPIIGDNPEKLHESTRWYAFVGSNDNLGDPSETRSLTDKRNSIYPNTGSTTVIIGGGHYATKHIFAISDEIGAVLTSSSYQPPSELRSVGELQQEGSDVQAYARNYSAA